MEDSNTKNKSGLVKKASKDFIFSVLALVIYNGVLQLLVYSNIEKISKIILGKKKIRKNP